MHLPATRGYSIGKFAAAQLGGVSKNQRDLLVKVLTHWISTGWWEVLRTCDGVTISTANLWTDWTKLQGTGGTGGLSWMQLRHVATGEQVLITVNQTDNTAIGLTSISVLLSVVGFTGGTISVSPSAADSQMINNPVGGDWLGQGQALGDQNPLYRAFSWVSPDGMNTRTYWMYAGHIVAWWQFDVLTGTCELPYPLSMAMYDVGNNYETPAQTRMRYADVFLNAMSYRWVRLPNGTTTQITYTYEAPSGGAVVVDQRPRNNSTLQIPWTVPAGIYKNSAGTDGGLVGYYSDQWWIGSVANVPILNDGDTAGGGRFIFIGQMMLEWDGTVVIPGLSGTVDYPATSFFGRDTTGTGCSCGPDECDTPTASLVSMRDGAKELADKVDDASVTDITWNKWINQGIDDLWTRIVLATGDAFLSTYDFTLVGGTNGNYFDVTTIPARDFRRLRFLEVDPDTTNRRRVRPFNFTEKDAGSGAWSRSTWDQNRRYRRMGTKVFVERYESAAGRYRLYYIPKPTVLVETCDEIGDIMGEFAEYPEVFAAMKALGKEEDDTGTLAVRLAELRADVAALKGDPDNDPDANVIADVEDFDDWGGR